MRRDNGSVLIDFLITLLVVSLLIPITIVCIGVLPGMLEFDQELQDEIALDQLRRILMISYDSEIVNGTLHFRYNRKDMVLQEKNGNLILSPGIQLFVISVDYAGFVIQNGVIYLEYGRDGKEFKKAIGHV